MNYTDMSYSTARVESAAPHEAKHSQDLPSRWMEELSRKPAIADPDQSLTSPADRVSAALRKGTIDGAGEQIVSIVQYPQNLLPAVVIGLGACALKFAPVRGLGVAVRELLPATYIGAAAVEIGGNLPRMRSAIVDAWNGSESLADASAKLRPLGHLAVTYGLAEGVNAFAATKLVNPLFQLSQEERLAAQGLNSIRPDSVSTAAPGAESALLHNLNNLKLHPQG